MKNLITLLAILTLTLSVGCNDDGHDGHDHDDPKHSHKDGEHDHKEGDHKDGEHDGHAHGEPTVLGTVSIGDAKVTVTVLGEVKTGSEAVFDVDVSGGNASTVRIWVGDEAAKGSVKAKLGKKGEGYHGHAEVPSPLPDAAAIWVELQAEDGEKTAGSVPMK